MMADFLPGAQAYQYWQVDETDTHLVDGGIIDEVLLTIYVNANEIATIMCSPIDEEMLALGFLYNEGIIENLDDVGLLKMNVARSLVDVILNHDQVPIPRRLTITSGCGGGLTLSDLTAQQPPLSSHFATDNHTILALIPSLRSAARLYHQVRGVHSAVLADTGRILLDAEDVGRHNTIDKIAGKALQQGIDTRDKILLTSGRISSEMASKARRMGVPVVISRTAPTGLAIQLAKAWNICLIGYARYGQFRVYTHPQRIGLQQAVGR